MGDCVRVRVAMAVRLGVPELETVVVRVGRDETELVTDEDCDKVELELCDGEAVRDAMERVAELVGERVFVADTVRVASAEALDEPVSETLPVADGDIVAPSAVDEGEPVAEAEADVELVTDFVADWVDERETLREGVGVDVPDGEVVTKRSEGLDVLLAEIVLLERPEAVADLVAAAVLVGFCGRAGGIRARGRWRGWAGGEGPTARRRWRRR